MRSLTLLYCLDILLQVLDSITIVSMSTVRPSTLLPFLLVAMLLTACRPSSPTSTTQGYSTDDLGVATPEVLGEATTTATTTESIKSDTAMPTVIIETSLGSITVELYAQDSPKTVENFTKLAKDGFYAKTKFHRVIPDFMIQGGDPLSKETDRSMWGTGGPGYQFADEFNSRPLVRGSLAMANAGPNTNGSQFFIVTAESTPWLDGKHTNFGRVIAGMDVVDKISAVATGERDIPVSDVTVTKMTISE